MAKKYQPSGYYIINLDLSDKTSGTPFTPETDDEKLLFNILSNAIINKPILLKLVTQNMGTYVGFPLYIGGALKVLDDAILETIYNDGSKLQWDETEL